MPGERLEKQRLDLELRKVIKSDDLERFIELIEPDTYPIDPLCTRAIKKNANKIVTYCFQNRLIDPHYKTELYKSYIHRLGGSHPELFKLFFELYVRDNPDVFAHELQTAFVYGSDNLQNATLLLEYGADPNLQCEDDLYAENEMEDEDEIEHKKVPSASLSAYDWAFIFGNAKMIRLYQQYGHQPPQETLDQITHTKYNDAGWSELCELFPELTPRTRSQASFRSEYIATGIGMLMLLGGCITIPVLLVIGIGYGFSAISSAATDIPTEMLMLILAPVWVGGIYLACRNTL